MTLDTARLHPAYPGGLADEFEGDTKRLHCLFEAFPGLGSADPEADDGVFLSPHADDQEAGTDEAIAWLQALIDLGYLPHARRATPEKETRETLSAPIVMLLEDLKAHVTTQEAHALDLENQDIREDWPAPPILDHIENCLAFDASMPPLTVPDEGAVTFASRLLQYRLRILTGFEGPSDVPFDGRAKQFLVGLGRMVLPEAHLLTPDQYACETVRLLGDVGELLRQISLLYGGYICVLRHEGTLFGDPNPRRADTLQRLANTWFDRDIDRSRLPADGKAEPTSQQGLRLLQVLLWQTGFYIGRIDRFWLQKSNQALADALTDKAVTEGEDVIRKVVRPLGHGYFALHLGEIVKRLRRILPPPAPKDAPQPDEIRLEAIANAFAGHEGQSVDAQIDVAQTLRSPARDRMHRDLKDARPPAKGLRARIGAAWRIVVDGTRRALLAVRDAAIWLERQLIDMTRFVAHGVRRVVAFARRSLRPYAHFILRRPITTVLVPGGPMASTQYDFDHDTVFWVAADCPAWLADRHIAFCRRIARNLALAVTVVIAVAKAVRNGALGPIGWGITLLRFYRVIRRLWMNRQGSIMDALV